MNEPWASALAAETDHIPGDRLGHRTEVTTTLLASTNPEDLAAAEAGRLHAAAKSKNMVLKDVEVRFLIEVNGTAFKVPDYLSYNEFKRLVEGLPPHRSDMYVAKPRAWA